MIASGTSRLRRMMFPFSLGSSVTTAISVPVLTIWGDVQMTCRRGTKSSTRVKSEVGESDRVGHSVSYSYQFYIALAIGGIISGVAVGWSLGLIPHQLSASNPATVEQKPLIAGMPTPNEKTIPTSNSRDPVPVVAFPEPEPNRSLAPVREPGPKTKSSKTRHDRGSSEISTATVQQRGKTLAVPVPETKPQTIEGWKIRDVVGSTVVLEGPGGVWRVTQGDTVPGVGKVDGIVRWGNRWIVSTSRGLISTQ